MLFYCIYIRLVIISQMITNSRTLTIKQAIFVLSLITVIYCGRFSSGFQPSQSLIPPVAIPAPYPSSFVDLQSGRTYLIGLINQLRTQQNPSVSLLYFDNTLNNLAQTHSVDMVRRNYFSHITPEGLTPQQRAKAQGFTALVGQNIVKGNTLLDAHLTILSSAEHYAVTVDKNWARVGFGILSDGHKLVVTILFGSRDFVSFPFSSLESYVFQTQLSQYIQQSNPSIKRKDNKLSRKITEWLSAANPPASFFDFLGTQQKNQPQMSYQSAQGVWNGEFITNLINQNIFITRNPIFQKYAFGFAINNAGIATVGVIFSA